MRDASAVVLYRRAAQGVEVFWLRREKTLRFAGGFFAFPGGRVDAADAALAVTGATGDAAKLIVTAARELFEETGVLKARGGQWSQAQLDEQRRALLENRVSFAAVLGSATLDAADFEVAGRWVTPPFMPMGRFDARFFLVEAPTNQLAQVWPGELASGEWIRPADALAQWERGTALLHPPNLHALQVMATFESTAGALAKLRAPPHVEDFIAKRLEFQRDVRLVPLVTPTLPPATHTNAYLLGSKELLLVDPGPSDAAALAPLVELLESLKSEGVTLRAIVATHHHSDHVSGVPAIAARYGVPVWAHEETAKRVSFPVARLLRDEEVLEGRWRVLHTPGHARGHVCLLDAVSNALLAGDMVSTVSTIVIDPPEGDMAEYLRQLRRLEALGIGTLYPAHGPVTPSGLDKVREYLMHREWRANKVLEALRSFAAGGTLEQLVPKAYDDVAAFVLPIAERNTVAILEKLEREGLVAVRGEVFVAR